MIYPNEKSAFVYVSNTNYCKAINNETFFFVALPLQTRHCGCLHLTLYRKCSDFNTARYLCAIIAVKIEMEMVALKLIQYIYRYLLWFHCFLFSFALCLPAHPYPHTKVFYLWQYFLFKFNFEDKRHSSAHRCKWSVTPSYFI